MRGPTSTPSLDPVPRGIQPLRAWPQAAPGVLQDQRGTAIQGDLIHLPIRSRVLRPGQPTTGAQTPQAARQDRSIRVRAVPVAPRIHGHQAAAALLTADHQAAAGLPTAGHRAAAGLPV